MHSMLTLGGLGACPPRKILKLDALRLNLETFQGYSHAKVHGHLNDIFMGQLQQYYRMRVI